MYLPSDKRYDKMIYSRCGRSGLKLPKVSMGLWQNFGHQWQIPRSLVQQSD